MDNHTEVQEQVQEQTRAEKRRRLELWLRAENYQWAKNVNYKLADAMGIKPVTHFEPKSVEKVILDQANEATTEQLHFWDKAMDALDSMARAVGVNNIIEEYDRRRGQQSDSERSILADAISKAVGQGS